MVRLEVSGFVGISLLLWFAVPSCLAIVYTVGDAQGWSIGVDYSTWASSKTFAVGDTLVFNYASGHTVDEVTQSDFATCTTGNPITTDDSRSTAVTLDTLGPHYFICGTLGHCGAGMKLAVYAGSSSAPITTNTADAGAATS